VLHLVLILFKHQTQRIHNQTHNPKGITQKIVHQHYLAVWEIKFAQVYFHVLEAVDLMLHGPAMPIVILLYKIINCFGL